MKVNTNFNNIVHGLIQSITSRKKCRTIQRRAERSYNVPEEDQKPSGTECGSEKTETCSPAKGSCDREGTHSHTSLRLEGPGAVERE